MRGRHERYQEERRVALRQPPDHATRIAAHLFGQGNTAQIVNLGQECLAECVLGE